MAQDVIVEIKKIIEQLGDKFRKEKEMILTEHDLQWQICHCLENEKRKWDKEDKYSIHAEVSWYTENDKLGHKPDISLILKNDINGVGESGDFRFKGKDAIIIELKFFRGSSASSLMTKLNKKEIDEDIEKMSELKMLNGVSETNIQCILVVFYQNQRESEELKKHITQKLKNENIPENFVLKGL